MPPNEPNEALGQHALTHVTLLGLTLTLPLSLTNGEASQARMQRIFSYRSAN
jgi:hypothetical protein